MPSTTTIVALIALAAVTAGCSGKNNRTDDGGPPPPPPPPPASYALAVTGVEIVNKDTGEPIVVGGLPAQGGELNIQ